MPYFAHINENGVCYAVTEAEDGAEFPNAVAIDRLNTDLIKRKHENGAWSNDKVDPQTTAPLTEFEQLKQQQALMQSALDELILGGGGGL